MLVLSISLLGAYYIIVLAYVQLFLLKIYSLFFPQDILETCCWCIILIMVHDPIFLLMFNCLCMMFVFPLANYSYCPYNLAFLFLYSYLPECQACTWRWGIGDLTVCMAWHMICSNMVVFICLAKDLCPYQKTLTLQFCICFGALQLSAFFGLRCFPSKVTRLFSCL